MDYIIIFDVIIAILGIYLVYSCFRMNKSGELSTFIIHREEILRCKDKKAFIDATFKPTLIFGMVAMLYGGLAFVNDSIAPLGKVFDIGGAIIFLAVLVWFALFMKKEKTKYFY